MYLKRLGLVILASTLTAQGFSKPNPVVLNLMPVPQQVELKVLFQEFTRKSKN